MNKNIKTTTNGINVFLIYSIPPDLPSSWRSGSAEAESSSEVSRLFKFLLFIPIMFAPYFKAISNYPFTHDRKYTEEEMWENLEYWIKIITLG